MVVAESESDVSADDGVAADAWRRSGLLALIGHPDRLPTPPPGDAPVLADAMARRVEAAARLSGLDLGLDGAALLGRRAALRGFTRRGRTSLGGACRLLRSRDGWVAVSAGRPDDGWLLAAAAGVITENGRVPWDEVAAWCRAHGDAEIAEQFLLLGVTGAPVGGAVSASATEEFARAGVPAAVAELSPRPLRGRRVVDFSAMWAGPLAAHLLHAAGAAVTTVETTTRPDGARRGDPDLHRELHAGHQQITFDPSNPIDRARVGRLVRESDIVIEASRPRALAAWGLSALEHAARGGTWVSITAAGRGSDRVGFGDDVAAGAGLVAWDDDGRPVFCGDAIADPLTGITAAALCASDAGGVIWDCSMTAVARVALTATTSGGDGS